MAERALVTGSSGLVGSEVADYFCSLGWQVHGVDNHMRSDFLGDGGDNRWVRDQLQASWPTFSHHDVDIRDRTAVDACIARIRPHLIVHAAAQPSHDLAARRPFDDFDVNAGGTLNLLEGARRHAPDCEFVHLSTNKVYGDGPNRLAFTELDRRWECADPVFVDGIPETFPLDHCKHSIFGASKLAADVMVQEYGRYFGMKTCCLRAGCITGGNHAGVELHGFLSYLIRCHVLGEEYRVYGHGGRQVRDNVHARDIATFVQAFHERPRCGEVYNIGGGRANSCSILEAFDRLEELTGRQPRHVLVPEARNGDHIWYISDVSRAKAHYGWAPTRGLDSIIEEILRAWVDRLPTGAGTR